MSKIRVGIIFGGRSGEHEISLRSAQSVMRELDRTKYEAVPIAIALSGHWLSGQDALKKMELGHFDDLEPVTLLPEPKDWTIYQRMDDTAWKVLSRIDVVFPVLHGTFGEDGTLQGLLEMAEIPYVGAGVLASSVGMDKGLFKDVMKAWGLPVVESALLTNVELNRDLDAAIARAESVSSYPLFTKPANLGSSVGVSKCKNRSDLLEGLMDAAQYDRRVLVERGVDAREIEVSVLGNEEPIASIPGEIIPSDEFYSYWAKYIDDTSELLIPAPMDEQVTERARQLAIQAFKAIDAAGMARVDFLLDREDGVLYLNELNTIPGFTSISMYPKLWEASGIPYPILIDRLIELALDRYQEKQTLVRSYEVGQ
jgi:D-alanine-D-alanine ligase